MELIQTEEARLQKIEGQAAEVGRLDLKDQEDAQTLQKELDQKLRDGDSIAACQKTQAQLEGIEQRRRGTATIREGFEEQAKATRIKIAELYRERFEQGVPDRVAGIKTAAANLTHALLAYLEQFSRMVAEDVTGPSRLLQTEGQQFTGKAGRLTLEAERLQSFVAELVVPAQKILKDIHSRAIQ